MTNVSLFTHMSDSFETCGIHPVSGDRKSVPRKHEHGAFLPMCVRLHPGGGREPAGEGGVLATVLPGPVLVQVHPHTSNAFTASARHEVWNTDFKLCNTVK